MKACPRSRPHPLHVLARVLSESVPRKPEQPGLGDSLDPLSDVGRARNRGPAEDDRAARPGQVAARGKVAALIPRYRPSKRRTFGLPGTLSNFLVPPRPGPQDRKSTRLNSSHVSISYAVFCLKKKKNK